MNIKKKNRRTATKESANTTLRHRASFTSVVSDASLCKLIITSFFSRHIFSPLSFLFTLLTRISLPRSSRRIRIVHNGHCLCPRPPFFPPALIIPSWRVFHSRCSRSTPQRDIMLYSHRGGRF